MAPPILAEKVSVTGVIRNILNNYPFSVGIFREFLQNSDDAKAPEQVFLLDCRTHLSSGGDANGIQRSLSGPALLAFNCSKFSADDWVAVSTISDSSKKTDTSKIGKFGIGLRSSYHITDYLQVLSGDTLLTFDPQRRLIEKGVLSLSLTQHWSTHAGNFKPFEYFLGGDWAGSNFDGTVIRLPLRKARGQLRDHVVSVQEIEKLMKDFISDEFNIAMLFLQHLASIKLIVIDQSGAIRQLGSCNLSTVHISQTVAQKAVTIVTKGRQTVETWLVTHSTFPSEEALDLLSTKTIGGRDVLETHKLRPDVSLALPLDNAGASYGQLFTYLRLPLATGFPPHIHAFFALTPSRQNLRNPGDNGLVKTSDDHLLVEWNKLLFEEFIPRAYARLFEAYLNVRPQGKIFKVWPAAQSLSISGESVYWNSFTRNVLNFVVKGGLSIWPTLGPNPTHKRIQEVFIATQDVAQDVLSTLTTLGFSIVRPPLYLANMLQANIPSDTKILTPWAVGAELRRAYVPALEGGSTVNYSSLLDYLLSASDVSNIVNLPIVPAVNGKFIALQFLQDCDDAAILLHRFTPSSANLLLTRGPSQLNLKHLDPERVVEYLRLHPTRLGLDSSQVVTDPITSNFLMAFWLWFDKSHLKRDLLPKLQSLYLIPSLHGLKQANHPVFASAGLHPHLLTALGILGVPFLYPTFQEAAKKVLRALNLLKDVDDIHALLDCLTQYMQGAPALSESDCIVTLKHFVDGSPRSIAIRGKFTDAQHETLRRLPIYPVVSSKETDGAVLQVRGALRGDVYGVSSTDILPQVPAVTFIDCREQIGHGMLSAIGAKSTVSQSPIDVLTLTLKLQALASQPRPILQGILKYLATNRASLTKNKRHDLKKQQFARAQDEQLAAPQYLIDPTNPIYPLYVDDHSRIPSSSDDIEQSICESTSTLGLFDNTLTTSNVMNRIQWISANASSPAFMTHSIHLLRVLYEHNFDCARLSMDSSLSWLPTMNDTLVDASSCRPLPSNNDDLALFDKVLQPLHHEALIPSSLTTLVKWDQPVPFSIIKEQLRLTLEEESSPYQRVTILFKELGKTVSRQQTQELKTVLDGKQWVPTSHYQLVAPPFAVFHSYIPEAGLYEIAPLMKNNPRLANLCQFLGCADEPSFDSALSALLRLGQVSPNTQSASIALSLLRFFAKAGLSDEQRGQLLVPDDHCYLRPCSDVVFNDIGERAILVPRDDYFLAWALIDEGLAKALELPRLGLKFVDLQDSPEDMGASPATLVQKTIGQYSEKQFLSEFLANAQDAGASTFSVVLNSFSSRHGTRRLLSQEMNKFYGCPSAVIYNDSTFSDQDFKGILRTHVGGKKEDSKSVGQFGLGALTMFHFTEVAIIISGKYVLFLDPTRRNLPLPRASLKIPLKELHQWYPDHLTPLYGIASFDETSASSGHFDGTIFMLPLRISSHFEKASSISGKEWSVMAFKAIMENFRSTAKESLLFTRLETINAKTRTAASLSPQEVWSACITRSERSEDGATISRGSIQERSAGGLAKSEAWIVITSTASAAQVPDECKFKGRKEIRIGLAASLDSDNTSITSKFFSTIPLAITTSLPVHVNASFFLASDRRSIRHDAHDSEETNFNKWLLSKPLPEIYLQLLAEIVKDRGNNSRWWPERRLRDDDDDDDDDTLDLLTENKDDALTTVLVDSFYQTHLPLSPHEVCSPMFSTEPLLPQDAKLYSSGLPSPIKALLRHIRPRNVVKLSLPRRRREQGRLLRVTPEFVKAAILSNANSLPFIQALRDDDLQKVLDYLGSTSADNLCGLPLLRLQDKQWATFALRSAGQTKYIWDHPRQGLFDTSQFIATAALSPELETRLMKEGLNIAKFDSQAVKSMVKDVLNRTIPSARSVWVTNFWDSYASLPPDGLLSAIEGLELVPSTGGDFVSLKRCKGEDVLLSSPQKDGDILPLIQDFRIVVVPEDRCPSKLKDVLRSTGYGKGGNFFNRFLHALKSSPQTASQTILRWPEQRRERFSTGVRSRLSSRIPEELLSTAKQLPIWPAQKLQEKGWKAATAIKRLPGSLSLDVARFLNTFACTEATSEHLGVEELSWQQLGSCLQVPNQLMPEDQVSYRSILEGILSHQRSPRTVVWLPDSNRKMVPSNTLYASQPLFEAAFDGQPDKFLLPAFSLAFEQRLRSQGLIKNIEQLDMDLFHECASSLSQGRSSNRTSRAAVVFGSYGEDLPLRVSAANRAQWNLVANLRFIPRDTAGEYNQLSLPLPIQNLPELVSPNQVVRAEFEHIAWTQRARFATQPNQRVLLANPDLGKPSATEVVAHLRALCAMGRDQDGDVLRHLKDTYTWLNQNTSGLRNLHGNIFLNVDDPAIDEWSFTSGDQMAFENHDVKNIQYVRSFLLPYRALLEVAGVIKVKYPEVDTSPAPENTDERVLQMMRTGFARQRENLVFTDVVFTAEEDKDEDDAPKFFAHRSFLSVFGSYFDDMFTGGFAEGGEASAQNPLKQVLPHSRFAIRTCLGNISLEDLLQSLELSHYLDVQSLFHNIQLEIIKRQLIDPPNLYDARQRAAIVAAERLVQYCDRYTRDNIFYISRILQN
ncbi:hypothetical protein BKA70DRAFT_1434939 [Coprinopsis sp. MPI-PUGE-AT-0042]|nr:hypothetical protein BKA70DRAFT_1434939 [Coprinopsis sp. MPI-PUGE-AT-0042]